MRSMFEDERTALRRVLFLLVACGVAAALLYTPPPPPPSPPSAFQGLLYLSKVMARLSPSSEPSASTAPPNSAAPSAIAITTPSSAASVTPPAASQSGRRTRTRSVGIADRKPGVSEVVEPWGPRE